jgi:hypothetical protein
MRHVVGIVVLVGGICAFASAAEKLTSNSGGTMVVISGENVWAISMALRSRTADSSLSKSERDLRNFDVRVFDHGDEIEVSFVARRNLGEDAVLGGKTSFGRDIAYGIRKTDGKLLYSHGFK